MAVPPARPTPPVPELTPPEMVALEIPPVQWIDSVPGQFPPVVQAPGLQSIPLEKQTPPARIQPRQQPATDSGKKLKEHKILASYSLQKSFIQLVGYRPVVLGALRSPAEAEPVAGAACPETTETSIPVPWG